MPNKRGPLIHRQVQTLGDLRERFARGEEFAGGIRLFAPDDKGGCTRFDEDADDVTKCIIKAKKHLRERSA